MTNTLVLLLLAVVLFSCGKKPETIVSPAVSDTVVVPDAVEPVVPNVVGTHADAHGCKGSAGYSWSELRKECVRIFEIGSKLSPYDSAETAVAYVIFDGGNAELFLPNEKKSTMLKCESEGMPFVNDHWQLIPWKGYVLKKDGKILYIGQ